MGGKSRLIGPFSGVDAKERGEAASLGGGGAGVGKLKGRVGELEGLGERIVSLEGEIEELGYRCESSERDEWESVEEWGVGQVGEDANSLFGIAEGDQIAGIEVRRKTAELRKLQEQLDEERRVGEKSRAEVVRLGSESASLRKNMGELNAANEASQK
ncbi:unnamed protein product [Sphagnum balticum]